MGNLYPNVRGGIPRAIGLVPFIILCFFFLPKYNTLVLIMGLFLHFFDDVLGRTPSPIGIEWGQISRGVGMLFVMIAGFYFDLEYLQYSLHYWYSQLTFLICSRDQPVWLQLLCLL